MVFGLSLVVENGACSLVIAGFCLQRLLGEEHRLSGFRSCCSWLSSCGPWVWSPWGMWDLPGLGIKPVFPALPGDSLTPRPPGKPQFSFTFRLVIIWMVFLCFVCCEAEIKDDFCPVGTEWVQHRLSKRPSPFTFRRQSSGPRRCLRSILILGLAIMLFCTEKGILQKRGSEGSSDGSLLWIIPLGPV